MAFIPALPVIRTAPSSRTSPTTITMGHTPISRRAALRLAAFSIAAAATSALADGDIDLEELKEDVEELSYEEEVTQVGPDTQEKIMSRIKKKAPPPKFRTEEAELVKEEEEKFDEMVAREKEEQARLKAQFSKAAK